jgi:hypothetical protein
MIDMMSKKQARMSHPPPSTQIDGLRWVLPALLVLTTLTIGGCGGCRSEEPQSNAAKEQEEKKKAKFENGPLQILPGGSLSSQFNLDGAAPISLFVKPGHWAASSQEITANQFDFTGRAVLRITDQKQRDIPVQGTQFVLRSERPVILAQGRPKNIESLLLVPAVDEKMRIYNELQERRSGVKTDEQWYGLNVMPPYQYNLVVLAAEPERYTFLKFLDSVRVPFAGLSERDIPENTITYRVLLLDISERIPLPGNSLAWTSVAYILWDEVDPELFTPDQQAALLDWLAWGGQIVMNGPDSLDLLAGSFLEPYLPAISVGSRNIDTEDLAELSRGWSIPSVKVLGKQLVPKRPWSGVALQIDEKATLLPATGKLLVERDTGRGRIVVSAMQLSEKELIDWAPHFSGWFNACLLRRPPRKFVRGAFTFDDDPDSVTLLWADQDKQDRRLDARLTTGLRYFTRDTGSNTNFQEVVPDEFGITPPTAAEESTERYRPGGIGGWNDMSAPANAARESLREAAGIEVPRASFVVMCVAVYLVVLVPLNWLFFRAVGHVEWAWIVAPLIAIVATFGVVHFARLDIGFVRAQTEVAILELQPEYSRGHLTRFTALYTSLATTYDIEFDNLTALAAPFPTRDDFAMLRRSTVNFEKYDTVRLSRLRVASNSTNVVHSEQMFVLKEPIRLGVSSRGHQQVENRSQLDLKAVGIIRRTDEQPGPAGEIGLEGCWVGNLASRESQTVSFVSLELDDNQALFAVERQNENRLSGEGLNLEPMMRVACDPSQIAPGETRLVGRVDEIMPGEKVFPEASQQQGSTLVLAHLEYGPRPAPRRDLNVARDAR